MKQIPLSNGRSTLLDDKDYERLSECKMYANKDGYLERFDRSNGKIKRIAVHREILQAPKGLIVDHIDGNKLDNRRENLRLCTQQQNNWNMLPRPGSSKCKGVYKENGRWRADVKMNGKTSHLGTFNNERDAAAVYNLNALFLFDEYARINNIDQPGQTISAVEYFKAHRQHFLPLLNDCTEEQALELEISWAYLNGWASPWPNAKASTSTGDLQEAA